jgi:drug/metabolite transporter (DMT)-like permease
MTSIERISRRTSLSTYHLLWQWFERSVPDLKIVVSLICYACSLVFQKKSTETQRFSASAFNVYHCSSSIIALLCVKTYYIFCFSFYQQQKGRNARRTYFTISQQDVEIPQNPSNLTDVVVLSLSVGVLHSAASNLQMTSLIRSSAFTTGFVTEMILILVPCFQVLLTGRVSLQPISLLLSLLFCLLLSTLSFLLLSECSDDRLFCVADGDPVILLSTVLWSFVAVMALNLCKSFTSTQIVDSTVYVYVISFSVSLISCFLSVSHGNDLKLIFSTQYSICCYYGMGSGLCEIFAVLLMISGWRSSCQPLLSSLFLCFEGVVTTVLAYFYLGETLTATQVIGGLIMTLATIFATVVWTLNNEELFERENVTAVTGRNSVVSSYQAGQSYHATESLLISTNKTTRKVILDDLEEQTNTTNNSLVFSPSVVPISSSDQHQSTAAIKSTSLISSSLSKIINSVDKVDTMTMFDDLKEIEESDESTSRKYFTYKRKSKSVERAVQDPSPTDFSLDKTES